MEGEGKGMFQGSGSQGLCAVGTVVEGGHENRALERI